MKRRAWPVVQILALGTLALVGCGDGGAAGPDLAAVVPNEPLAVPQAETGLSPDNTAVLAGGCFWGVEAVFESVKGVLDVVSGYSGGTAATALYPLVIGGVTDHAETVRIRFDPDQISYEEILRIFFLVAHDPTQLDRQHPDVGPAYRSHIFHLDEAQRSAAVEYMAELDQAGVYPLPIVTRLDPLQSFYPAEEEHQDFVAKNPDDPYVVRYDIPKLADLEQRFPEFYQP